jgi:Tfp pilus assembly protein PilN
MKSPNELSFLPEDYLERKAQRRTNAICATLFLVVMVAIGSAFTITERGMREAESKHAEIEAKYTEAAKRIEQVQQMQEKQRRMAMQAELTASLLEKVPRSFLLAEVTNAIPTGVSLIDLVMESRRKASAAPATPKTPFEQKRAGDPLKKSGHPAIEAPSYEVLLKITGIANTDVQVAQFITRLNQSPLLRDVNLIISDEYKGGESKLRKFQIDMMLHPQADVATLTQKATAVELVK